MHSIIQKILGFLMSILAFFGLVKAPAPDPVPFEVKGSTVAFAFDSNPTTGYGWTYALEGDCIRVERDEYVQDPALPGMAGVGGTQYYTFEAVREGTATVTFTYARAWEQTDADRVITAEIAVSPDLTVSAKVFGAKDA